MILLQTRVIPRIIDLAFVSLKLFCATAPVAVSKRNTTSNVWALHFAHVCVFESIRMVQKYGGEICSGRLAGMIHHSALLRDFVPCVLLRVELEVDVLNWKWTFHQNSWLTFSPVFFSGMWG
jgi:hypothetical protein